MDASRAIESLKNTFPGDQVVPRGTEQYSKLNSAYLSLLESEITPACIFQPKNKEDVSKFLKACQPFAASGEVAFAIRGGGQQPLAGCANIQDGITLDLSLLRGIEVKESAVCLGAGEIWGPVYEKLSALGLGVLGSRSSKGGVGGLALAGGLSFFASREGFICDSVVNYEVVLASGAIVNANASENTDLWIALRGGGNNFGIVTRYDMRTFKQGPFWGGHLFYFLPNFPGQVEAMVNELQKGDASDETHLMMSIGHADLFGGTVCMNQMYYTQEVEKPAILEQFTNIQPQMDALNSMKMRTLAEAADEQAADSMGAVRCAYMNSTVKADAATLLAGADIFTPKLDAIKDVEGIVMAYTLQPYAHSLLKKSASLGGNSLPLDPSMGPLVSILLLAYWKNKSDDNKMFGWMTETLEKINAEAKSRGTLVDYEYLNYAAAWQDPLGSYGPENKRKMQEVSKKYDPEGMFQKSVPGGFKLFT